jgi:hypothetical protein
MDFGGYGFGVMRTQALRFAAFGMPEVNRPVFIRTNQYHHVVAVREGSGSVRMYLDGSPVGLPQNVGSVRSSIAPLHLGRNPNLLGLTVEPWPGRIDEAAVYDRALTASEVCAHYMAGLNVPLLLVLERPDAGHIRLIWPCGTLQEADAVTGPWLDAGTTSPQTLAATSAKRFYQVRR